MNKKIGANYTNNNICEFSVWAPLKEDISLHILSDKQRIIPMQKDADGYFSVTVDEVVPGTKYLFHLEANSEYPDPASFYQPDDVMGPSCVVDHSAFVWDDKNWQGCLAAEMIIYELHAGTFTPEGTFDGIITKLSHLQDLGVNTIEIMPVAQFPGTRNWGYDGVYPFAVQNSYGGPAGLKRLVNECHKRKISVILDVVYNHFGPEGNFLRQYMPCFTDKYKTAWGEAINFDDAYSYGVRDYFIQNALYWLEHFHMDALRLDAVHGIFDMSAKHILKELSEKVTEFSRLKQRKYYLIAESDLNDRRVIDPDSKGGYGLDAQWNDDFHHCLHTLLTKENQGYYEDFGQVEQMAKALKQGFVYSWDYSKFRKRYHGSASTDISAGQFVVFSQNHDQIGNRVKGERLSALVSFEALKVAAGTVLLSANIPLLFMGEEYGENAPFLYFMSFHDKQLIEAIRAGRKKEFASFNWQGEPDDPYAEETFLKSKLKWDIIKNEKQRVLLEFYKKLIQIRKSAGSLFAKAILEVNADEETKVISITRLQKQAGLHLAINFHNKNAAYTSLKLEGQWKRLLVSSDIKWLGPGTNVPEKAVNNGEFILEPFSLIVFEKKQ
ncbi:MAG: malto-oligosyltrehalose trehalohydrolase [Candidatus Omnitrophota bacterium]